MGDCARCRVGPTHVSYNRLTCTERKGRKLDSFEKCAAEFGGWSDTTLCFVGRGPQLSVFAEVRPALHCHSSNITSFRVELAACVVALHVFATVTMAAAAENGGTLDLSVNPKERGVMTTDKATELLKDVLDGKSVQYTGIALSGWSITPGGAAVVAKAMEALPLTRANLANTIASRPEAEGLKTFETLGAVLKTKTLLDLNLSDNAVGAKGVASLTPLLQACTSLHRLAFNDCGMSSEAVRSVCEFVTAKAPTHLTSIEFFNNMAGGGGAAAAGDIVLASPRMQHVRFASTRGDREGGAAIGTALAQAMELRSVDLSDNTFGHECGVALAAGLLQQQHLHTLKLGDVTLENKGMLAIASKLLAGARAGVGAGVSLQHLDISFNELDDESLPAVAALVARLPSLETIILDGNELYAAGAAEITSALAARAAGPFAGTLQRVQLHETFTYGKALVRLAEAAAALPNLQVLSLDGNFVSSEDQDRLAAIAEAGGFALGPMDETDEDGAEDEEDAEDETQWQQYEPEEEDAAAAAALADAGDAPPADLDAELPSAGTGPTEAVM